MTTRTCTSPASAIARSTLLLALLTGSAHAAAPAVTVSPARDVAEAGLVDIRTLAPAIEQDIRYAGVDNFTGRRVPSYDTPKCYLLAPAATALAQVEADLRTEGFALRLFDCYRPAHAVKAFVAWAHDPQEQSRKALQYPDIDKPALLGGYIAETSGHSRAATVDLTLLDCRTGPCAPWTWAPTSISSARAHIPMRRRSARPSATTASSCARRWPGAALPNTRWGGGLSPSSPSRRRPPPTTCRSVEAHRYTVR